MNVSAEFKRFAPTLRATLLTLAGVALFVALGFWQLDRAAQKRALLAQADAGELTTLTATAASLPSLPRYQRVRASGRYDSTHQVLLDNMYSAHGRPGYRVLTPLQLAEGAWLLVDRGWIAPGRTRVDLPDVAVAEARRSLIGRLDQLPAPGIRMGDGGALGSGWPRVLHFPTHAQLEQVLERPLLGRIVLLDPEQADGYDRAARPLAHVDPGRHIGYAVQWFAFALVALAIYIVTARRTQSSHEHLA